MSIIITRQMSIEDLKKALAQLPAGKVFHAIRHCGVIKLREDPLAFQKRVRDEWQ
jgi:hypothetical protein